MGICENLPRGKISNIPKFDGIIDFDVSSFLDKISIFLKKIYALLGVYGQIIILVLKFKKNVTPFSDATTKHTEI